MQRFRWSLGCGKPRDVCVRRCTYARVTRNLLDTDHFSTIAATRSIVLACDVARTTHSPGNTESMYEGGWWVVGGEKDG